MNLKNPLVLINYLLKKPAVLKFKNEIFLMTTHPLEAIVAKETVIDDEYFLTKNSYKNKLLNIIDVGAGIGDFTIFAAKEFPWAKITAVEPNKKQCQLLLFNVRLNKITNVSVYQLAIGTKKSYDLFIPSASVHASTVRSKNPGKRLKVKGKKLDEFIQSPVDLLKVDCEGAEIDILKSISPEKTGLIKRMVIEYHNHIIKNEDKKISAILKDWRFSFQVIPNQIVRSTGYIVAVNKKENKLK